MSGNIHKTIRICLVHHNAGFSFHSQVIDEEKGQGGLDNF